MRSFRLPLVVGLLAVACSAVRPSSTLRENSLASEVQAPGLRFKVLYLPSDASEVQRLRPSLLAVAPRLSRWGQFSGAVEIQVHPSHAALEAAIDRRGYPWLHAWSYEDAVLIESPRGWSQAQIDELLVHELTHALMFQLISGGTDWPPFWFREGMASVTADQGYRRMGADELALWRTSHPGVDLLNPDPELFRIERRAVYAAAHRAFEALLDVAGDAGVRAILRGLGQGQTFSQAFAGATGRERSSFEGAILHPPATAAAH